MQVTNWTYRTTWRNRQELLLISTFLTKNKGLKWNCSSKTFIITLSSIVRPSVVPVLSVVLTVKIPVTSAIAVISSSIITINHSRSRRRSWPYNYHTRRWCITVSISVTTSVSVIITGIVSASICTGWNAENCKKHSDYCNSYAVSGHGIDSFVILLKRMLW